MTTNMQAVIEQAIKAVTLGDACEMIQSAIGQTDGGIAGIVFSDLQSDDDWLEWDEAKKRRRLIEYVAVEESFTEKAT